MTESNDRSRWFPYSYSKNKEDIIYRSSMLNCTSEFGCGTFDDCEHNPKWKMFDFDQYFTKDQYDYLTMGCSVTYGSDIRKKDTWRSQLTNSVDLSVPGIGIDAIWHNLKFITNQNKIKFDKIIILLPSLTRKAFKIYRNGLWFDFLVAINEPTNINPNFAFKPQEMTEILEGHKRQLVQHGKRYNELVLDEFCEWLNKNQTTKIYISSWDTEVYSILEEKIKLASMLLEIFPAGYKPDPDHLHPSKDAHLYWFEKIKDKI